MEFSDLPPLRTPLHPSPSSCHVTHDSLTSTLSLLIILGLVISYLPQHYRIIANKTSEGIDAKFLLLGATSSASSFLNVLALQWSAVRCCRFVPGSECAESLLGVVQVGAQWLCFNVVFLLFLVYFPPTHKYVNWVPGSPPSTRPSRAWRSFKAFFKPANFSGVDSTPSSPASEDSFDFQAPYSSISVSRSRPGAGGEGIAKTAQSTEWRQATNYAILTTLHLVVAGFVTFLLLLSLPKASQPPLPNDPDPVSGENRDARVVRLWATALGLLSTVLALLQYLIQRTWNRKLVGSLSIPMMCIQTPGSFVFVYSLAVRPGVNWTAWAVYLITGILQGCLLVMCICWAVRQKRLGIDAYGKPLSGSQNASIEDERRPLL